MLWKNSQNLEARDIIYLQWKNNKISINNDGKKEYQTDEITAYSYDTNPLLEGKKYYHLAK